MKNNWKNFPCMLHSDISCVLISDSAWFIANGCKTVVALTQADTRTAEQAEVMRQAVIQSVGEALRGEYAQADGTDVKLPQNEMPPLDAVSVCSVGKAFGREELLEAMFGDEVDIMANILSHDVVHKLSEKLRTHIDGECAALTVRDVRSNINGQRNRKIRRGIDERFDAFMKSLLKSEYKASVRQGVQNVLSDANVALPSDEAAPLLSAKVNTGEEKKKESVTFMKVVCAFWRVALTPARKLWETWFRKDREDAILLLTLYADGAEVKAQRQIEAFLPQIKREVEDMLLSNGQKVPPLIEVARHD